MYDRMQSRDGPTRARMFAQATLDALDRRAEPEADKYSTSYLVRHLHGKLPADSETPYELEIAHAASISAGTKYTPLRPVTPWRVFARALGASPGSAGGYLIGSAAHNELALLLTPYSLIAEGGCRVLELPKGSGNVVIPVEKTAATGVWLAPGDAATSGEGTLAQLALTPHTFSPVIDFSLQLAEQAAALADRVIAAQLMNLLGAKLDAAIFTGAGGKEPTGIIHRGDITPTSGTTLSFASIVGMKKAVLAAGARESRLRWFAAPDVQETLSKREKAAGSGFIWADGKVADIPAIATARVPAGYLILLDPATLTVAYWGSPEVEKNGSAGFPQAYLSARVLTYYDAVLTVPSAVAYAASVT